MQINIQKSAIPIIWLDTFFIIEYGKITLGKVQDKRYTILYNILLDKIQQKKLLCARAEQEDEIEDNIEICMNQFLNLTKGFKFKSSTEIQKLQTIRMMNTYNKKCKEYNLSQSDVLRNNKIKNNNLIIDVYSIPNEVLLHQRKIEKQNNLRELQDFKDNNLIDGTFEQILENEYKGIYYATSDLLKKAEYIKKMYNGEVEFDNKLLDQFMGLVGEPLQEWGEITGRAFDIDGYLQFLLSKEHKAIPCIDISTHLIADIVFSTKDWGSGDSKDISNISVCLPYTNYILTDKAQSNRIKRFGLDKKYKCEVFCMRNIEDLIKSIEVL